MGQDFYDVIKFFDLITSYLVPFCLEYPTTTHLLKRNILGIKPRLTKNFKLSTQELNLKN
jgi:Cys-tRNA synthase (O-phospho-L-seryl-tRNA:Cys-tRNA synthase)